MGSVGQQEIYEYLKKNKGKWFSSSDISEALGISLGSATCCLQRMRGDTSLEYKLKRHSNGFLYKYHTENKDSD